MVLQKAIDNAKGQSKEDKTAIATGIATFVVAILMIVWGFFFLRKIHSGTETIQLSGSAQDEFNFSSVKEAQRAIEEGFKYSDEELKAVRESAVERQLPVGVDGFDVDPGATVPDQFGTPTL